MKTRSAKNKGKRLQNKIVSMLQAHFGFTNDDIRTVPSSVIGEDIILTREARKKFPFSIEAKNQEKLNIWKAIEQAKCNSPDGADWLVVFSRNYEDIYVTLNFSRFLAIIRRLLELENETTNAL